MNSTFVSILQKLISEQGKEALLNPARCKAFLADYTKGEYKKESRLLLQALEARVPNAIDSTGELGICKQQQARVLREEHFLTEEAAADVIDTLALVLRGEPKSDTSLVCSSCGKELQKEWKACPYCGTQLANISQVVDSVISSNSDDSRYDVSIDILDERIRVCTDAIKAAPNNAYIYSLRGGAYLKKGEHDRAIIDFTMSIKFMGDNFSVYRQRGEAYLRIGEYEKAIIDFDKFFSLYAKYKFNPSYISPVYHYRGLAYNQLGKKDQAIQDFNNALRLDPNLKLVDQNLR